MQRAVPTSLRAFLLLAALGTILAGCAARQPAPSPTAPIAQLPWTAAIGKLMVEGQKSCTAMLVARSTILTAAHCLHQGAMPSTPRDLHFMPNFGGRPELPTSDGVALRAQGGAIQFGRLKNMEQVAADWALIDISPAVTAVRPLSVQHLTTAEILQQIAQGSKLFTAGYGYGAMKMLKQHTPCQIMAADIDQPVTETGMLVTTCIIRLGDSGGPLVLIDPAGKPSLVGVFAGFGTSNANLGLSYAANAGNVAPYLAPALISALPQVLLLDQDLVGRPGPIHERHRVGRD